MNEVAIYYLEMKSVSSLRGRLESKGLEIRECEIGQFQVNKFLYQFVGADWDWVEKLTWKDERWRDYAESDDLRTWIAHFGGSIAGYYELQKQNGGDVEIAYLGMAPKFVGQGFGGYLLTHALTSAWRWRGTRRVWVHTCTLDHPGALHNYEARGMTVYRVEADGEAPERTPGSGG